MKGTPEAIERAQREVARTKAEFQSTLGTLQYRLKPANLVSDAWDGLREKSGEMADGAIQTVKERPVAASGILAAVMIFLAREPLWRAASSFLFSAEEEEEEVGILEADLDHHDKDYDLTAPMVKKSKREGVTV